MFLDHAHGSPTRLKQDAQSPRPSGSILNWLTSSPPPGGRGAIRAQCAEAAAKPLDTDGACGAMDPRPYIERSLKNNRRTTLRVKTPDDDTKRMWADVREATHQKHYEMISEMARLVKSGSLKSRDDAVRMQAELVASWPQ